MKICKEDVKEVSDSNPLHTRSLYETLYEIFLPHNFPHSVHDPDSYLKYQLFDTLQGLCSYLRGALSMRGILKATTLISLSSNSSVDSIVLTWLLRDGISLISSLLFTTIFSPSPSPRFSFSSHLKEFRLFADFINDVGMTLDLLLPICPNQYLLIMTLSGVCKTLCGVCASVTKPLITNHFAKTKTGNQADLNAKENSQETFVTLLGLALGALLTKLTESESDNENENDVRVEMFLFLTLTFLHLIFNWIGVRALHLRTLNYQRISIIRREGRLLTPREVGERESFIFALRELFFGRELEVGAGGFAKAFSEGELTLCNERILCVEKGGRKKIFLHRCATDLDAINACLNFKINALEELSCVGWELDPLQFLAGTKRVSYEL